ncbi:hypothetical protein V8J82_16770 [Gymnodinialimonas sp. 2305UL16-5]|uniref:hypothetical protein n=1 Tax=Gymnodinialimonas mytili TaxID=3126503 RepID=UPI0030AFD369
MRPLTLATALIMLIILPAAAALDSDVPAPAAWRMPEIQLSFMPENGWPASMSGLAWTFDAIAR